MKHTQRKTKTASKFMIIIINTIEALLALCGAIWTFLYYTGRLNYSGEKEERRREKVQKYGWALILGGFMCLFGSIAIIVGTFIKF